MPELDERLRETLHAVADRLVAPPTLDGVAFQRARQRIVRRRIGAGAVAAVGVAALVAVPLTLRDSSDGGRSVVAEPATDAARSVPQTADGWTRLDRAAAGIGANSVTNGVSAGGPGFVAVGYFFEPNAPATEPVEPAVWTTSVNGMHWRAIPRDALPDGHVQLQHVAATDAGLVAVGLEQPDWVVWTSPDGREWEEVARGPHVFPGAPEVRWPLEDERTPDDALSVQGVTSGGRGILAYGSADYRGAITQGIWTSTDGTNWVRVLDPEPPRQGSIRFLVRTPQGYLAVGPTNRVEYPDGDAAWFSTDGLTWTGGELIDQPEVGAWVTALATGGRDLLAAARTGADIGDVVRPATVWRSTDGGHTWAREAGFSADFPSSSIEALAKTDAEWIAVGTTFSDGEVANTVDGWASRDAVVWDTMPPELHPSAGGVLNRTAVKGDVAVAFSTASEFDAFYVRRPA